MSLKKPKIGDYIEYWYNKKFQKGEITEKTKEYITIKLWNNILNPKIITINYPTDWRYKVKQNSIISRDKNKIFPSWIKIYELCIICESRIPYHSSSKIIAKIAKYKDGKNITLYYIKYPTNSYDMKKLKTMNINISNIKNISLKKKTYITFTDNNDNNKQKILYPYFNQIEIDDDYDKINDINNNKLIQNLWKNRYFINNNKSTNEQINEYKKKNDNEYLSYVTTSKLQYGVILECNSFPFDINRLIISFLAQRMIYICPPTPCNKNKQNAQMWQFDECVAKKYSIYNDISYKYELSIIGIEFVLNDNLFISGFELNNIELLGRYKHKICLNGYIETIQLQLNEQLRNAQFVFKQRKLMELKKNEKYTVSIEVNANVPCYQCHETPSNVDGFIDNNSNTIYQWKCFKYITWKKFKKSSEKYYYKEKTLKLEWFPHFAFLLP